MVLIDIMTKENFEKTFWYRLLKVVFIFIFISGLIGISMFALSVKPTGPSFYEIECNNGKIIKADLSPGFTLTGEWADHGNIRCAGDSLSQINGGRRIDNKPSGLTTLRLYGYTYSIKNESAPIKENIYWVLIWALISLLFTLVLWFVVRLFYYISFGESVFRKPKKLFD